MTSSRFRYGFAFVLVSALAVFWSPEAQAQSFIRQANNHTSHVEVEVHGILNWNHWWGGRYGAVALGPGFRIGIPLMQNGFVRQINNMPTINFGADLAIWFYPNGWVNNGNTRVYTAVVGLVSPVMLQWNFYVHPRWSVGPELGFVLNFWFNDARLCDGLCIAPFLGFWPGAAIVARYHFREGAGFPALTMRLGFPTGFNIGVSF